ncbi:MAG TPA: helix-turn-helix transcriptional regulator [Kofleriaceae bacterium]|nr:helix-turn-helix transcriptional regulator [Kofleriaceae bacterium]
MRALPLTNKSRPGGRPRQTRAPRNPFADWLASCGKTPEQLAKALGVSVSSVYNARNGYFKPGRDLAVKIAEVSEGAVPVEAWGSVRARKRKAA